MPVVCRCMCMYIVLHATVCFCMFLVGYPQKPEPVISLVDWHKLTYLVLTCRKTPINQAFLRLVLPVWIPTHLYDSVWLGVFFSQVDEHHIDQTAMELLRQHVTEGGFYDPDGYKWQEFQSVDYIAITNTATTPGSNVVSPRLMQHFTVLACFLPGWATAVWSISLLCSWRWQIREDVRLKAVGLLAMTRAVT